MVLVSPSPGAFSDAPRTRRWPGAGVTSHGLSLRLEPSGGVSAGLLHFPAGNAASWRHQAHRIIEAGPGASSATAARWPAPSTRLRGRERAWSFRGSGLTKSPAFGAFVCWRGDHVA